MQYHLHLQDDSDDDSEDKFEDSGDFEDSSDFEDSGDFEDSSFEDTSSGEEWAPKRIKPIDFLVLPEEQNQLHQGDSSDEEVQCLEENDGSKYKTPEEVIHHSCQSCQPCQPCQTCLSCQPCQPCQSCQTRLIKANVTLSY